MDSNLLNGFAGIAALVNSLLMWPIVRSLKHVTKDHGTRISRIEALKRKTRKRRVK